MKENKDKEQSTSKIGKQIRNVLGDLWEEKLKELREMSDEEKKKFLKIYRETTGKDFPYPI